MWWIDNNPDAETFRSPQEALRDWARDHTTLPSCVYFGREGAGVAVLPREENNWTFDGGYKLGGTFGNCYVF